MRIENLEVVEGACGVVVSRLLCMQKASGSNPDKSICYFVDLPGSSPTSFCERFKSMDVAAIAQLGERQTEDLEVPGSIPGLGIIAQLRPGLQPIPAPGPFGW